MKPEEMRDDIPMDVREALAAMFAENDVWVGKAEKLMQIVRPKPRTVHLPAADLPAPLEEVLEDGEVWTLDCSDEDVVWRTAASAQDAVNNGFAWATEADAEAWLAHLQSWKRPGVNWTPHTPGDPMPCDGKARIEYRMRDGTVSRRLDKASVLDWRSFDGAEWEITAWRYGAEGEA